MWRQLYLILFKLYGSESILQGRSRFFGPPSFLIDAGRSIDFLRTNIPEIFNHISRSDILIVFHIKKTFYDPKNKICSVGKAYADSHDTGISALLIHMYFTDLDHTTADRQTEEMLKRHDFPFEIVDAFREKVQG